MGGGDRGGVPLIFRKMRLLIYRVGCLRFPPLLNPLPALRWRGEETRGAGQLRALEMVITFDLQNGLKPS